MIIIMMMNMNIIMMLNMIIIIIMNMIIIMMMNDHYALDEARLSTGGCSGPLSAPRRLFAVEI